MISVVVIVIITIIIMLRTEAARKSFLFQGPLCYNELPLEIHSLQSIVLFRSSLKKYYDLDDSFSCKYDVL